MEIDPDNALKQFTTLCNIDHAILQHHLASNSMLEWFGRTIRGRTNVYPYFRFDLCQQYEHGFEKAERCEAFETKPSHLKTRIIPDADKILSEPTKKTQIDETSSTPFQRISTPTLPKVGKGKYFIAPPETPPTTTNIAPTDNVTQPPNIDTTKNDGSPPSKRIKTEESSGCAGDAGSSHSKDDDTDQQEFNCDNPRKEVGHEIGQGDCLTLTPDTSEIHLASDTGYSDLMYLETIGFLHTRNRTKHRGVTDTSLSTSDINSKTPNINVSTNSTNDLINSSYSRKTKLKLSYRIRRHDNQLQFVLIIYEHLTRHPATRRNLLSEFQKNSDSNVAISESQRKATNQPANTPKKSLKRLLRLF